MQYTYKTSFNIQTPSERLISCGVDKLGQEIKLNERPTTGSAVTPAHKRAYGASLSDKQTTRF